MTVQALNISHLVIASTDVALMTRFFEMVFSVKPHYANQEFADFVLPGKSRVAFFKPLGKSAEFFSDKSQRDSLAIGLTVSDVNEFYNHCLALTKEFNLKFSGPPKEHPWGEPSFLLIDPEGNRWEITHSPTETGELINR